jgi:hypothetical protein
MRTFRSDERAACQSYVVARLVAAGLPSELSTAIAPTIMETCVQAYMEGSSDPNMMSLVSMQFGWAIRDSDLDLVKSLVQGSLTAAVAGLVAARASSAPMAPAMASLITGLTNTAILVHQNLKQNGASLDPMAILILSAIKKISDGTGATSEEIAGYLSPTMAITETEVTTELKALEQVTIKNGDKKAFAFEQAGKWRTDC